MAKEACRKRGISNAMCYARKNELGGLEAFDIKRMRVLESKMPGSSRCSLT